MLKDITIDNYREAIRLKVASEQEHFVASNVYSIAQSKFHSGFVPMGIYNGDAMVGFLMHGKDDDGSRWIMRLMVDEKYQGKGYGRAAMELILKVLRADPGCKEVGISYAPENEVGRRLYASLGFVETGEVVEGELVARLRLEQPWRKHV